MTDTDKLKLRLLGEITDMIPNELIHDNPFLRFLPQLLVTPEFSNLNLEKVKNFTRLAIAEDKQSVVADALKILNQLIRPDDGSLKKSAPDIFYGNYHFNWKELGNNTTAPDVIRHVLNKTLFVISLGQA
jgi:hypothetical protein